MHGVKGLNAQVVFIPGLEEDVLPGEKRKKKTGLVEEAARLLYVSITRARAACILSYSTFRMVFGKPDKNRGASQFARHLNGRFEHRNQGFTDQEYDSIETDLRRVDAILNAVSQPDAPLSHYSIGWPLPELHLGLTVP